MDTTLSEASLARWQVRLGRAADLIAARLDDPPSLDELAAAAAVSPFHLHRIWRGLTGETVRQSIARLRIEAVQPALSAGGSVTDAAMAAGFATPQAFARAFRRTTGTTPSLGRAGVGEEPAATPIRIELRDAVTVVALRRQGGEYVALNAMFQAVWDWAEGVGAVERLSGLYGIPYDDPDSVAVADLRYAACMVLRTRRRRPRRWRRSRCRPATMPACDTSAVTTRCSRCRNGWSANGCRDRGASRVQRRSITIFTTTPRACRKRSW